MSVFKIIVKPVRGQMDNVYLYLYKFSSGMKIPELTSLKIKVQKKYCVFNGGQFIRVSKKIPLLDLKHLGFSSIELLNDFLNDKLSDFISIQGDRNFVSNENKTLNDFFEMVISRTLNQGTKMRYNNVKNVIEGFQRYHSREILKTKETSIIYLKNIDTNYIELFRNYLLVVLKNTQNTSNYKLKCLKSIINKSIQEGYYNFNRNPFINVKFSHPETKIEILDLKDIEKLIKTDFKEVYRRTIKTSSGENLWGKEIPLGVEERNKRNKRYIPKHTLNDIRNYFLFQLFSQGIRVSDLITLRWMNFITTNGKLKISKKMVKTKDEITILVNDKMIQILSNYVVRYKTENTQVYNDLDEKIIGLRGIIDNFYFLIGPENKFYKELMDNVCIEENLVIKNLLIHIKVDESMVHKYISLNKDKRKHPLSKTINPLLEMYNREKEIQLPILKKKLNLLIKNKQKQVCKNILKLSDSVHKNDFVFELLNPIDFINIIDDDFSRMSVLQYRKFQSVRSYYNKNLKLLRDQCGIDKNKNLTSHLSRHSYTSLMVELGENINLFDVMTSLGHKHLKTTQMYLKRFSNKKIDQLNQIISDKLDNSDLLKI